MSCLRFVTAKERLSGLQTVFDLTSVFDSQMIGFHWQSGFESEFDFGLAYETV